jgi:Flp pilus assembly protein protease CpaA
LGGGLEGLLLSLGGIGAGFALWLVSNFLGRIMGGGDIKLLMALGALMGAGFMLWTFAIGAIAGGVMAVAISLRRGLLGKVGAPDGYLAVYAREVLRADGDHRRRRRGPTAPTPIALGLGALITIGMRLWTEQGI